MKQFMYSIRDSKTTYGVPFVDKSDDSAKRGFAFAFENQQSLLRFSPSDFSLYRIGTFDNDSAKLQSCPPVYICSGSDFFKMKGDAIVEE